MNKTKFHILVVDDDNRIRELVREYLVENDFLVTTAIDAQDAKKKLKIIKFDIMPNNCVSTINNRYFPILFIINLT